jgi:PAS domain S-box-containing protein
MGDLHDMWHKLTAPRSSNQDEAQQEYMTKVILTILILGMSLSVFPFVIGWRIGVFPLDVAISSIVVVVFLGGGWWLAHRGRWRQGSYVLLAVFSLLAIYLAYFYGLETDVPLVLTLMILLTAMLLGDKAQWGMLAFSIGTSAGLGWVYARRHPGAGFALQVTLASLTYVTVTLLLRFFVHQYQRALVQSRAVSLELAREIAKHEQAEQALMESEEKFRSFVENANDIVYTLTPAGLFAYASPNWTDFLGHDPADVVGKSFVPFTHPDDAPACIEFLQKVISTGEKQGGIEYRIMHKDGAWRYHTSNASAIKDDEGNVVLYLGISHDITERKRAEEELKRYRDHLEELVEERTQKLEEAQAELVRQERLSALGQLAATVAHDIRNPLSTIRTSVFAVGDAIERDEMERVGRALQLAERNIVRCDTIISELLDYTRDRVLQLRPTPIDAWLEVVLDEQTIPREIVCTRKLDAGVQVPINGEHLRRAIVNVVNNGVDALQDVKAQGNQLTVSTHVVEGQAGSRLEIRVRDTGCGIPTDMLDRVFEPLFSTKSLGVGLGLPIVKNILEQHDGGVAIQSEVGQETTVVLWLPIDEAGLSTEHEE